MLGGKFTFGIGGAPTYRGLASACSPAPTHPNFSQLGLRAHPPNPASKAPGGPRALDFPYPKQVRALESGGKTPAPKLPRSDKKKKLGGPKGAGFRGPHYDRADAGIV